MDLGGGQIVLITGIRHHPALGISGLSASAQTRSYRQNERKARSLQNGLIIQLRNLLQGQTPYDTMASCSPIRTRTHNHRISAPPQLSIEERAP